MPKIESTLKPSNNNAKSFFLHVYGTKVQTSTPCLRDTPWNFARVLYTPAEPLTNFYVFFSPEMRGPLDPNIQKKQKHKYLAGKKRKRSFYGSAGACKTRVLNFRVYLSTTAWTLDTKWIGGDKLVPACRRKWVQTIRKNGKYKTTGS